MINVVASIRVKPGSLATVLAAIKGNVPAVRAEAGCVEYQPTVDVPTGLPAQQLEPDAIVLIEKWDSLDALRTHLAAPHMAAYREKVKGLVEGVSLKVTQKA